MRWLAPIAAAFVGTVLAGTTVGQTQATSGTSTRGNQLAYEHSMRCFIANLYMVSDAQERGDQPSAEQFERRGQQVFDGAVRLGTMVGKTNAQITVDLDAVEARELPKLVRDAGYRANVVGVCRQLGLMPS